MNILHLTLKKKWFDMIASGEKKEEYREIKPFFVERLIDCSQFPVEEKGEQKIIKENICFDILNGHYWEDVITSYYSTVKPFDAVKFINGYSKKSPTITIKFDGLAVGQGMRSWGAEPDKEYFIIKLGEIIK